MANVKRSFCRTHASIQSSRLLIVSSERSSSNSSPERDVFTVLTEGVGSSSTPRFLMPVKRSDCFGSTTLAAGTRTAPVTTGWLPWVLAAAPAETLTVLAAAPADTLGDSSSNQGSSPGAKGLEDVWTAPVETGWVPWPSCPRTGHPAQCVLCQRSVQFIRTCLASGAAPSCKAISCCSPTFSHSCIVVNIGSNFKSFQVERAGTPWQNSAWKSPAITKASPPSWNNILVTGPFLGPKVNTPPCPKEKDVIGSTLL